MKARSRGVAGPETANNAAATASMVPLLALGIPFAPITALMMSSMMVHGVQPGPLLVTQHPEIFWGVIASMYIGNVMLLILNIPMIGIWVSLLRIPQYIFLPVILLVAIIGSYSVNNSMLDLYVLFLLGIAGYVLRKLDFHLAPMVVGVVLGPLIEKTPPGGTFHEPGGHLPLLQQPHRHRDLARRVDRDGHRCPAPAPGQTVRPQDEPDRHGRRRLRNDTLPHPFIPSRKGRGKLPDSRIS